MKYKRQKAQEFQKRAIKGKTKISQEEKENLRAEKLRKRNRYEAKNKGNFDLIYPSEEFTEEEYQKYLDTAAECYEEFNNGGQASKKRAQAAAETPVPQQTSAKFTNASVRPPSGRKQTI